MNEQIYTIGPLMKAARKFKKFNQADVAKAIGCSQSALSKMEHNLLIPSAPQWFLFSRYTAIPPESLEVGIIDRHSPINFSTDEVSQGFKIPKRYRQNRVEKVREVYPFFQFLEKHSPKRLEEFIQSTGIDPEFFLDFDNLVNFQLIADLMEHLIQTGHSSEQEIKAMVDEGQNDIYWDHFGIEWKRLTSLQELLKEFAKVQIFFQADFQIILETQERVALTYQPEFHLKQSTQSDEVIKFLHFYRKFTLESLVRRTLGKEVRAEITQEGLTSPLGTRLSIISAA